jgi:hypothetical protein
MAVQNRSPWGRLEKEATGFKRTGAGIATFDFDGASAEIRQDTDQCLLISAPVKNGHVDDFGFVFLNRFIQGPCKFASDGSKKFLMAEMFLGRKRDRVMRAFEASKDGLRQGMQLVSKYNKTNPKREPSFFCKTPAAEMAKAVEEVLADLGISATRKEDASWAWPVDTNRFLHRIRLRVSEKQKEPFIHVEAHGDPLPTDLSPDCEQAVGRFLLEMNRSIRFARCAVAAGGLGECPVSLVEAVAPLCLFDRELTRMMVEAVVTAGEHSRAEVNALCHPDVARAYLAMRQL